MLNEKLGCTPKGKGNNLSVTGGDGPRIGRPLVKIRVLFLSTQNSCRSQMAEGLANHCLGEQVSAVSAGTEASSVHPSALAVMSEVGIDISGQHAKSAEVFSEETFDFVISLLGESGEKCKVHGAGSYCGRCGEPCPHLEKSSHGGERVFLLGYPDPSQLVGDEEQILTAFRNSRDAIKAGLERFFEDK